MDQYIHAATRHVPWNKGKLVGQKAPSEAEGYLGDSSPLADPKPHPRTCLASRSTTRWKWQSRRRYRLSRRWASVECGRQPARSGHSETRYGSANLTLQRRSTAHELTRIRLGNLGLSTRWWGLGSTACSGGIPSTPSARVQECNDCRDQVEPRVTTQHE